MSISLSEQLKDWNPQLFREAKGRLNVRNVALSIGSSLLVQLLIYLSWWQTRINSPASVSVWNKACRLRDTYSSYQKQYSQLQTQAYQLKKQLLASQNTQLFNLEKAHKLQVKIDVITEKSKSLEQILKNDVCPADAIDSKLWWQHQYGDLFILLCIILVFVLLVWGIYLLINDLSQEERKGTLNFIRLTPTSEKTIFTGKILGVPILIYLVAIAAVPLHLWAGFYAKIPLSLIVTFYGVLVVCCIFFYSGALLFGLISSWMGVFPAWLGSAAVCYLLWLKFYGYSPTWLRVLIPWDLIQYLFSSFGDRFGAETTLKSLQWFYLPVGSSASSFVALMLLNYGLWTYWIWQGLKRCFRNPNSTIISKFQSYCLVACLQVIIWGFALQTVGLKNDRELENFSLTLEINLIFQCGFNVLLLISLIAILSPKRQVLQEWVIAQQKKTSGRKNFWNKLSLQDLIFGEKSPAIVAMTINTLIVAVSLIAYIFLVGWSHLSKGVSEDRIFLLCCVIGFINLMLIYASIAQLMLLRKNQQAALWATVTIGGLIFVPHIILNVLNVSPDNNLTLWLFISFPRNALAPYLTTIAASASERMEFPTITEIFLPFFCHWGIFTLLNLQFMRRLQKIGESASKTLLKDSPILPSSSFK